MTTFADKIKSKLDARTKIITEARAIHEKAEKENRALTAEERANFTKAMADANAIKDDISSLEELQRAEAWGDESRGTSAEGDQPGGAGGAGGGGGGGESDIDLALKEEGPKEVPYWKRCLEAARGGPVPSKKAYREAYADFLRSGRTSSALKENRSLQADSPTAGGYMVAPIQMVAGIIKAIDDLVFIRQLATKYPVTSSMSLGSPALDANPSDADWTTEIKAASEDTTMTVGKRELTPKPLTKLIKVSNKLMRLSTIDPAQFVADRLAYKFGITQEKAFLTGTGAGQPLGVFTASSDGIATTRDVSTGNTTTSIKFDGLIAAKMSLKAGYRARARWLFHRDAISQIITLKDSVGQYLWQPAVSEGQPDRVLGIAAGESEYAPNTFTTGLYVGIIGDFSYYWIADGLNYQLQRLNELYAVNRQTGFIAEAELDGMPVLGEAFARVKLA